MKQPQLPRTALASLEKEEYCNLLVALVKSVKQALREKGQDRTLSCDVPGGVGRLQTAVNSLEEWEDYRLL